VQDGNHFFDEGYPYAFKRMTKYGMATKREIDDMADHGEAYDGKVKIVELRNVSATFGDLVMFK
jgi:hypothetical protein